MTEDFRFWLNIATLVMGLGTCFLVWRTNLNIKRIERLRLENKAFWTYENEEGVCDEEFETLANARDDAQEDFDERCMDGGDRYNNAEEDITLIHRYYDDDGEPHDLDRIETTLYYEYERSDLEEHGTWNRAGTGVR